MKKRLATSIVLALCLCHAPLLAAGMGQSAPVSASATDDALARLQQRIAQVPLLRGEFSQEKRVRGFKQPLRSSGKFLIASKQGVVWTTLKPFPSEMVLTRERILSRGADGKTRVAADARQQPALRQVNGLLFALLRGDLKALSGMFDLHPELLPDGGWRLLLLPRDGAMKKTFGKILLRGDRHVRQVDIEEQTGDTTALHFSNLRETPEHLSADEARHFE